MRFGWQHPDGRDRFLVRRHRHRPIHESRAHDQAGKQFGWAQGVGLHVFPKIMLYIMVSNSKKT